MARNHRALDDRFTYAPNKPCHGLTAKGERCYSPARYGALAGSTERATWKTENEFYCHRHATALLAKERSS